MNHESRMMMRVLHITAYYAPAYVYGGPPRSIHGLVLALQHLGVDVDVFTTDANGSDRLPAEVTRSGGFEGVRVQYFRRDWPSEPIGSRPLARALRRTVPACDIVHIHGLWNRVVWAAAREARRAAVPYVVSPRGMLERAALAHHPWLKRVGWTLVERRTVRRAALLHATSEQELQTLRQIAPSSRVALVPNGIEAGSREVGSDDVRRDLGLVSGPIVLFLGRIHPIKRLDLLIEAFALARARRPDARLVIAGPDEAGLRPILDSRERDTVGTTIWLGEVDRRRTRELLAAASVLVMCSDSESFGMSVIEAMDAGVPVVVTRTCPWSEVEQHGAGFWVEQRADAIADALLRIFERPDLAHEMGARGRALVATSYSWNVVAQSLVAHYAELIAT
jgi:glycosyltransferase involved in cell wall biosynthesis